MLLDLVAAASILTAGAILQAAVGFGIGLVAVPLLLWIGWPLPWAMAAVLGAAFVQTAAGSYAVRREIRWRSAAALAALVCAGVPAGFLIMETFLQERQALAKQAVGGVVLAVLVARFLFRPEPRSEVPKLWRWLAGLFAGFFGGLVGMGGPPLVFYAMAHDWSPSQYKAFLWPQLLLTSPVLLVVLTLRVGSEVLPALVTGLALAPLMWLGTRIGLALSARWNTKALHRSAVVLLAAIGVVSIVGPLLSP